MSDDWLRVIPTEPAWVPAADAAAAARALVAALAPRASEVTAKVWDEIIFVDQGENFDAVRCPACALELDKRWWGERMDEAYAERFARLAVTTPCCGANTSLNDLAYDCPAGFARFVIDAMNPDRFGLTTDELEQIALALGHPVREIWRRI